MMVGLLFKLPYKRILINMRLEITINQPTIKSIFNTNILYSDRHSCHCMCHQNNYTGETF